MLCENEVVVTTDALTIDPASISSIRSAVRTVTVAILSPMCSIVTLQNELVAEIRIEVELRLYDLTRFISHDCPPLTGFVSLKFPPELSLIHI